MPCKSRFVALGAALLAVTAVPALAADEEELTPSWANVNICNASQLGVRAQLAGDGSKDTMRVRFSAEWLSPDGWVPLAGQAASPWLDAGSAEFTWAQAGWTFNISVPAAPAPDPAAPDAAAPDAAPTSYQLRGVAEMKFGGGRSATQTTGVCAISG
jgi:hypothetical protein